MVTSCEYVANPGDLDFQVIGIRWKVGQLESAIRVGCSRLFVACHWIVNVDGGRCDGGAGRVYHSTLDRARVSKRLRQGARRNEHTHKAGETFPHIYFPEYGRGSTESRTFSYQRPRPFNEWAGFRGKRTQAKFTFRKRRDPSLQQDGV